MNVRFTVQAGGMSQVDHAGVEAPVAASLVDVREILQGAVFGEYVTEGVAEALAKRAGTPGRVSEIVTCFADVVPEFVTLIVYAAVPGSPEMVEVEVALAIESAGRHAAPDWGPGTTGYSKT